MLRTVSLYLEFWCKIPSLYLENKPRGLTKSRIHNSFYLSFDNVSSKSMQIFSSTKSNNHHDHFAAIIDYWADLSGHLFKASLNLIDVQYAGEIWFSHMDNSSANVLHKLPGKRIICGCWMISLPASFFLFTSPVYVAFITIIFCRVKIVYLAYL